ncbi:MAG: hypothetical protein ACI4IL_01420 [Eubacterium sp.]
MDEQNKKSNSKNVLVKVLAVCLAALMLIGGGTYAYLNGQTEDVVNNFERNKVLVEISETTGSNYSIIPGTSASKDPKVTVNTTIPAYVYVTVIDNTEGLIDYAIADGWIQLKDAEGNDVNNVYYREVEGSDTEQIFSVLKDDKVNYDAALENSDMVDSNGNLLPNVTLSFNASAIQKEPFNDPYDAYTESVNLVTNETELRDALAENPENIVLGKSFTVTGDISPYISSTTENVNIDLNGYKITVNPLIVIANTDWDPINMKVSNGKLETKNNIAVYVNSSFELDNIEGTTSANWMMMPYNNAEIKINNSNIVHSSTGSGGIIGTNSNNETGDDAPGFSNHCNIEVRNSVLSCDYSDGWTNSGILLGTPGTLTIDNSQISGERFAVFVRCGTANITNSTLTRPYALSEYEENRYRSNWGQATNAPYAALGIGNAQVSGNFWGFPAAVTMDNVTLSAYTDYQEDDSDTIHSGRTIYMYGRSTELSATLDYTAANCDLGNDDQILVDSEFAIMTAR